MDRQKTDLGRNLTLVAVSFFVVILLIVAGEVYCRCCTSINFLDVSRGLFAPGRYGTSYGNTPHFSGVAFGERFFTDENGFRADPQFKPGASKNAPAILIVGDSVSFGPGVREEVTIAGRLRRMMPGVSIDNASAIGYDVFDYKNLVDSLAGRKTEIKTVLLFYCLNDLNDVSAQQIRNKTKYLPDTDNRPDLPLIGRLNNYLRSRSKLYLFLKNTLRDVQMTYFRYDLAYYQKDNKVIQEGLRPLADIHKQLTAKGIAFRVYILPYEAQLRSNRPAGFLLPQKRVTDFLRLKGIAFRDVTADFEQKGGAAHDLFLYGDPMHLSERGHQLVAEVVCGELQNCPGR